MGTGTKSLANLLDILADQVVEFVPEDVPLNHNLGWTLPGVLRSDLELYARDLAARIRSLEFPDDHSETMFSSIHFIALKYLREQSMPNFGGHAERVVPAYLWTMWSIERAVATAEKNQPDPARAIIAATKKVRAIEARLNNIEPKASTLEDMVSRIELAHEAADQLPVDLQALSEAKARLTEYEQDSDKNRSKILAFSLKAEEQSKELQQRAQEAAAIVARCNSAYSAATSVGLSAAFSERSRTLGQSSWVWVVGLIIALSLGALFGSTRIAQLANMLGSPYANAYAVAVQMLLAVLSIGGPIWFAWLATKQIGQRFRLSEDYAFKASVSRAYEGYRKEAERIDAANDSDMEARLLASALSRLDEQPLRLVETSSYGSPLHELAASQPIKDALAAIPGFGKDLTDFARAAVQRNLNSKIDTPAVAKPETPHAS